LEHARCNFGQALLLIVAKAKSLSNLRLDRLLQRFIEFLQVEMAQFVAQLFVASALLLAWNVFLRAGRPLRFVEATPIL